MPNPASTDPEINPPHGWPAVHEDSARSWPPWLPKVDESREGRRYAWSVPGLALVAPVVLAARSAGGAARQVVEAGRSGGVFTASRQQLALVLHELGSASGADVMVGDWPSGGVVRRIAVTVTLERAESVLGSPGSGARS